MDETKETPQQFFLLDGSDMIGHSEDENKSDLKWRYQDDLTKQRILVPSKGGARLINIGGKDNGRSFEKSFKD